VTANEALLWTDGRYFLQAETELDPKHWKLMKDRLPNTVPIETYLCEVCMKFFLTRNMYPLISLQNLPPQSKIGIDPTVLARSMQHLDL
jgi:hypothetical protein